MGMCISQVEEVWLPERDTIRREMGYGLADEWGERVIQAAERLSFCYARCEHEPFRGPHAEAWLYAYEQRLAAIVEQRPIDRDDFSRWEAEWWARYRTEHPDYDMKRAQARGRLF